MCNNSSMSMIVNKLNFSIELLIYNKCWIFLRFSGYSKKSGFQSENLFIKRCTLSWIWYHNMYRIVSQVYRRSPRYMASWSLTGVLNIWHTSYVQYKSSVSLAKILWKRIFVCVTIFAIWFLRTTNTCV